MSDLKNKAAQRPFWERMSPTQLFLVGASTSMLAFPTYILTTLMHSGPDKGGVFASFWAAGRAVGSGDDPFSRLPNTLIVSVPGPDVVDLNLNPPALLPIFQLLSALPLPVSAILWSTISLALFLIFGLKIANWPETNKFSVAWIAFSIAMMDTILIGQIYVLMFVAGYTMVASLRAHRLDAAALVLGLLIAAKPNFALALVPLFLARHFRLVAIAGSVAGLVTAASIIAYGPENFLHWLAAIPHDDHWIFPTTVSLISYFQRLGAPFLGYAFCSLVLALAAYKAAVTRPDAMGAILLGLLVAMLCSPLCWFHYILVALPFIAVQRWDRTFAVAALLMTIPPALPLLAIRGSTLALMIFGGVYTLAILLIFVRCIGQVDTSLYKMPVKHSNLAM